MFFDSAGVRIHFEELGRGEPVVLVHGYMGCLKDWMSGGSFPRLAEKFRVIAFDCRGHGQSDKPHDPSQYGGEMGNDVIRLLDHLSIPRAHMAGYSMGAHAIGQLLTTNPQRLASATLIGAPGRLGWTRADDHRVETEAAEMEQGLLRSYVLRLALTNGTKPTEAEIKAQSEALLHGQDRFALAAIRRSNRQQVVTEAQMRKVTVPMLGVVGSADSYLAGFYRLKSWMPQLQLVIVAGGTHASIHTGRETTEAIRAFLTAHPHGQAATRGASEV
jgi:pimeloyl-ACP methyl ester carboxylesterase